jgi:hypothetical protein
MLTSEELKALRQHIENAGGNARNGEHIRAALAILQAAKDRPQPAVDKLIEAGIKLACDRIDSVIIDAMKKAVTVNGDLNSIDRSVFRKAVWNCIEQSIKDAAKYAAPVTGKHWSDCAMHNEPAYPNGPCDCGANAPSAAPVDLSIFSRMEAVCKRRYRDGDPVYFRTFGMSDEDGQFLVRINRMFLHKAPRLIDAVEAAVKEWEESDDPNDQLEPLTSAAPVDPPKVLTDEVINRLWRIVLERCTEEHQAKSGTKTYASPMDYALFAMRYVRDNAYLAPAKVDEGERAALAWMRHQAEALEQGAGAEDRNTTDLARVITTYLAPAKVDVDAVMEIIKSEVNTAAAAVKTGIMEGVAYGVAWMGIKSRLTKLFNATT